MFTWDFWWSVTRVQGKQPQLFSTCSKWFLVWQSSLLWTRHFFCSSGSCLKFFVPVMLLRSLMAKDPGPYAMNGARVWMYNLKDGSFFICTAVKSNALAELMNRASKIHWKNLSLTLNGRNSETKNDKNNPKVPKFSSCRGLSSTLSRKCGSTTICGRLWVFCGCLWVFLGVCGC